MKTNSYTLEIEGQPFTLYTYINAEGVEICEHHSLQTLRKLLRFVPLEPKLLIAPTADNNNLCVFVEGLADGENLVYNIGEALPTTCTNTIAKDYLCTMAFKRAQDANTLELARPYLRECEELPVRIYSNVQILPKAEDIGREVELDDDPFEKPPVRSNPKTILPSSATVKMPFGSGKTAWAKDLTLEEVWQNAEGPGLLTWYRDKFTAKEDAQPGFKAKVATFKRQVREFLNMKAAAL